MGRWIITPSNESARRRRSQPVGGTLGRAVRHLSAADLKRGTIERLLLLFDPFTAHTDGCHRDRRPYHRPKILP
jgi:hypothetical protein